MNITSRYVSLTNNLYNKNNNKRKNSGINFSSLGISRNKAYKIELELAKNGIDSDFCNNAFVAECAKKVIDIFKNSFGGAALPKKVSFEPLSKGTYGAYDNIKDTVYINSDYSFFTNMKDLEKHAIESRKDFQFSTSHPAGIYVHEFAHAAHWHHLEDRLGFTLANKVWWDFLGKEIPTSIGKLVTILKVSKYPLMSRDMCEFVAEKATSDICDCLTRDSWEKRNNINVDYSELYDPFSDDGGPQAFLDRYMQLAWNGDSAKIDIANSKAGTILENCRWIYGFKNLF